MALPQNGVWKRKGWEYHIGTISSTTKLNNSIHFFPFILAFPFPCAIFPFILFSTLHHFAEEAFDIIVVKQKLGTIKCYFRLLCECVVWYIGHSGWMRPC